MRTNRKSSIVRATGVGAVVTALSLGGALSPGAAQAAGPGERPVGRAEGKVLSASLFGRQLDFGTSRAQTEWRDGRPVVAAEGVGLSALAGQTRSAAQLDTPGGGGRRCATPPPGMLAVPGAGPAVPTIDVSAACKAVSCRAEVGFGSSA